MAAPRAPRAALGTCALVGLAPVWLRAWEVPPRIDVSPAAFVVVALCERLGTCPLPSEEEGGVIGLLRRQSELGLGAGPDPRGFNVFKGMLARRMPDVPGTELATSVKPIAWLHVPKCGSSLLSALIRIPGACPNIPEDVIIHDGVYGGDNIAGFFNDFPRYDYCPGAFSFLAGNHYGIGAFKPGDDEWYEMEWKGHLVSMFRDPQKRILSAWRDNRHSWPASVTNPPPDDPVVFAKQVQGCVTKMLTRGGVAYEIEEYDNYGGVGPHWGGPCGEGPVPSRREMDEAKKRLTEGFAFFGIVEEWHLSMCLFHKTFGGPCNAAEFIDSRHFVALGSNGKLEMETAQYDADILKGFVDEYDSELYAEATRLFWEKLRSYNLSHEGCAPCYKEAGDSALRLLYLSR